MPHWNFLPTHTVPYLPNAAHCVSERRRNARQARNKAGRRLVVDRNVRRRNRSVFADDTLQIQRLCPQTDLLIQDERESIGHALR